MSRATSKRLLPVALLASLTTGCTHYHYYGKSSPYYGQSVTVCDPALGGEAVVTQSPVIVQPTPRRVVALPPEEVVTVAPQGAICDVPPSSNEPIIIGPTGNPSTSSPAVVSSAPASNTYTYSSPSRQRYRWRRPDPEGVATTRMSGQIQSSQVR